MSGGQRYQLRHLQMPGQQQFFEPKIDAAKLSAVDAAQKLYAVQLSTLEHFKMQLELKQAEQKMVKSLVATMKKRADQAKDLKLTAAEEVYRGFQADEMIAFKKCADEIKALTESITAQEKVVKDLVEAEVKAGGVLGAAETTEKAKNALLTATLVAVSGGLIYGGFKCSAPK